MRPVAQERARARVDDACGDRRQGRSPAWLASVPYQGIRPRSSRTSVVPIAATHPPTAGPAERHRRDDRGHRDGLLRSERQLDRQCRRDQCQDDPEGDARERSRCSAGIPSRAVRDASAISGSAAKHKSRDHERDCTQSHDSSDVDLEERGIDCLVRWSDYPNSSPSALESGNRSKRTRSLGVTLRRLAAIMATLASATMTRDILAFIGRSYQPLAIISGLTLDPPSRPSCSKNTKTDQTRGRSVALLAPLHPKCPFQVELLRVRAS